MNATQCWEHALAGSSWLQQHQHADGSWESLVTPQVNGFYKGSWAFLATGRPASSHRLLSYVRPAFMTSSGDFAPRGLRVHQAVHYPYVNAYLIVGAMLAARYETAMPALAFLVSQQDVQSGGFYSQLTATGATGLTDTMSTAAAGTACLAGGRLDCARRAAQYLANIAERHPNASDRFYSAVEPTGNLCTEPREAQDQWWRVVEARSPNQCWYALGYPFAFLLLVNQATGDERYRTAAQWYFDFLVRCVNPWSGPSSGKAGWGCAMLYRMSGEPRYRDIALGVADYVAGMQEPDGNWIMARVKGTERQSGLDNPDYDVTAEYSLWLALIASNILARDSE
jgi:hypothetical protein